MSEETIPQMRERIETLSKEVKSKDETIDKLNGDIRVRDSREAFRAAGYNPKHGDLFAKDNPEGDITSELVASYAEEWDLAPLETSSGEETTPSGEGEESTSEGDDGSGALAGMNRSGSGSGQGGGGSSDDKTYTRQEWAELNITDPVKAAAALNQGRVETSSNPNAKTGDTVGRAENPYVSQHMES